VESRTDSSPVTAQLARLQRLQAYSVTDPSNTHLLGDLSDLALQLGEWAQAKTALMQWLTVEPEHAIARYRLAVAERASGQAAAAQALLAALVAEGHRHPAVVTELARAEAQLGAWPAALAALEGMDLAALPADNADTAWLLRVRALHHMGDIATALAAANAWQAARGDAMPTPGLAALATLQLDAEQLSDAEAVLKAAGSEAILHNAELGTAAGLIELSHGRAEAAEAHLARAAVQQPALGRAHLGLGLTAAYAGNLPRAIDALKTATAVTPGHLGSWHALAWMQMLNHDLSGADASLRAALAQDASFGETHGGLALVAALKGNHGAAEQHLRTAQRLDPRGVNVNVARLALQEGPGALDGRILAPALERFMGLTATQSPAMQALLARMVPRRS
jgi:tetratricopeptide (TPR) repeat protein